jgi:hypothetical protein
MFGRQVEDQAASSSLVRRRSRNRNGSVQHRAEEIHPTEPIPKGITNCRYAGNYPVAVACNQRLLWVDSSQLGDLDRAVLNRYRRSGPGHHHVDAAAAAPEHTSRSRHSGTVASAPTVRPSQRHRARLGGRMPCHPRDRWSNCEIELTGAPRLPGRRSAGNPSHDRLRLSTLGRAGSASHRNEGTAEVTE